MVHNLYGLGRCKREDRRKPTGVPLFLTGTEKEGQDGRDQSVTRTRRKVVWNGSFTSGPFGRMTHLEEKTSSLG